MKILNFSNKKNITFQKFFENQCPTIFGNSWYMNFSKFMVPKTFAKLILFNRLAQAEEGTPFLGPFFGIQCPTIFCDFGLFNRLAQAGGGGPYYMIFHYQKHTVLNYLYMSFCRYKVIYFCLLICLCYFCSFCKILGFCF